MSVPPSTRARKSASVRPSTYSITRYAFARSTSKSYMVTMLGCASMLAVRASASASLMVDAAAPPPWPMRGIRLMATLRCRRVSQQVRTVPKPPASPGFMTR